MFPIISFNAFKLLNEAGLACSQEQSYAYIEAYYNYIESFNISNEQFDDQLLALIDRSW